MKIGAIVLAANKSEKMGQNTQLLKLNGKTIIESILDALSDAGINEQVIVLGEDMGKIIEAIRPKLGKIKIALNVAPEKGIASSVQTGIIVLSDIDGVFLVLGDQPILDSGVLKAMIVTMEKNQNAQIITPIHKGKKGHPQLFRKNLLSELMDLKNNQTAQDIIHLHSDNLLTVEAPDWSILDFDTPEDYVRILNSYKSK